jgi:hypothetical protein
MRYSRIVVCAIVVSVTASAHAATVDKPVRKRSEANESVQRPALTEQQRAQIAVQATQKLTAEPWSIYIFPQGSSPESATSETLTFTNTGVEAKGMKAKGYNGSNYSLTIQDDGAAVWETVQRDADNNFLMWRGELRGEGMNGIVSQRSASGASIVYSFSSAMPKLFQHQKVKAVPQVTQQQSSETKVSK